MCCCGWGIHVNKPIVPLQSAARKGGTCQVVGVSAFFIIPISCPVVCSKVKKSGNSPVSLVLSFLSLRSGFTYLEANKSHLTSQAS